MAKDDYLQRYVEYIGNTGRVPLPTAMFDEDWEPIGPMVRARLKAAGLIEETEGGITLAAPPGAEKDTEDE